VETDKYIEGLLGMEKSCVEKEGPKYINQEAEEICLIKLNSYAEQIQG